MTTFATSLAIESWTLYGIALFLVACRMASRRLQLGSFSKYQWDDYTMLFIVLTFTGVIVSTNQVANNGSNYLPPGAAELLTPVEVVSAIYGSKMTLILEEFTLVTTWLVKACMLMMYSRMTLRLKENVAVKFLAVYCIVGFIVVQVLYLAVWCRPIQQYWAVPVVNSQCATYYNHMITATVFNVSSDLMMLLIPLPLLITSKLPLKRKLILCGVFSLGIFVILAAVLNRYFNFTVAYSPIFLNWYVGEVATAVFVSNIPLCWPLVRRIFSLDAFGNSTNSHPNASAAYAQSKSTTMYGRGSRKRERLPSGDTRSGLGHGESEERITGSWSPQQQQDGQLELHPIDNQTGFKTQIAVGKESGQRLKNWESKEAIVKTVQISQHHS